MKQLAYISIKIEVKTVYINDFDSLLVRSISFSFALQMSKHSHMKAKTKLYVEQRSARDCVSERESKATLRELSISFFH